MGVSTETQKSKTLAGKPFLQGSVGVCCFTSKELTPRGHHTIGSKCLTQRKHGAPASLLSCSPSETSDGNEKEEDSRSARWLDVLEKWGEAASKDVNRGGGGH